MVGGFAESRLETQYRDTVRQRDKLADEIKELQQDIDALNELKKKYGLEAKKTSKATDREKEKERESRQMQRRYDAVRGSNEEKLKDLNDKLGTAKNDNFTLKRNAEALRKDVRKKRDDVKEYLSMMKGSEGYDRFQEETKETQAENREDYTDDLQEKREEKNQKEAGTGDSYVEGRLERRKERQEEEREKEEEERRNEEEEKKRKEEEDEARRKQKQIDEGDAAGMIADAKKPTDDLLAGTKKQQDEATAAGDTKSYTPDTDKLGTVDTPSYNPNDPTALPETNPKVYDTMDSVTPEQDESWRMDADERKEYESKKEYLAESKEKKEEYDEWKKKTIEESQSNGEEGGEASTA